jgi:hypothetical protein
MNGHPLKKESTLPMSTIAALDAPELDADLYVRSPYAFPSQAPTHCRLRVYRGRDGAQVALVTELASNSGMSITNAAEHVWAAVARRLDTTQFAMVEHYDSGSYRQPLHDETFDLVWVEGGRPRWRHLGPKGFQELLP